jgi:hypothetical protein
MVFSFMLIMSMEQRRERLEGQQAPDTHSIGSTSSLAAVPEEAIGKMIKNKDRIYLMFGNDWYDPQTDLDKLERDKKIQVFTAPDGSPKKYLYLEDDRTKKVLLVEYLSAFDRLSRNGIHIAFSEPLK